MGNLSGPMDAVTRIQAATDLATKRSGSVSQIQAGGGPDLYPHSPFDPATENLPQNSLLSGCFMDSPGNFLARAITKFYQAPSPTAIGGSYNYAVAVSDVVPTGKYWRILRATAYGQNGTGADTEPILWLVPQTSAQTVVPSTGEAYFRNPLFSQSATVCNALPVVDPAMLRVDDLTSVDIATPSGIVANQSVEWNLLRGGSRLFVPTGCRLAVSNHGVPNSGQIGIDIALKIYYVEMPYNEIAAI